MARNEQEQSDGTGRWIPEAGPVVCCVTGDATLRDECARAAAVAGVVFEGVPAVGGDAGLWTRADLVLLGADVGEVPPQRRGSTVLVGGAGQRRLLWDRAAALGIDAWDGLEVDLEHRSLYGVEPEHLRAALVAGCGADVVAA